MGKGDLSVKDNWRSGPAAANSVGICAIWQPYAEISRQNRAYLPGIGEAAGDGLRKTWSNSMFLTFV